MAEKYKTLLPEKEKEITPIDEFGDEEDSL